MAAALDGEQPTEHVPEVAGRDEVDAMALRRDLLRALAALPRGQRAVVVLRYFEDLTEAQTAQALGLLRGHGQEPVLPGPDRAAVQPVPDRGGWVAVTDLEQRLRAALDAAAPDGVDPSGSRAGPRSRPAAPGAGPWQG